MNHRFNIPGSALYDDMSSQFPGWRQGNRYNFDRLEVSGGALRIADAYSRRGVSTSPPYGEETDPWDDDHPPSNGGIYPAIGWVGREMGTWTPDIEITWSGLWDIHEGHHAEATPLLWIDEDNPLGGFGAWPIMFGATEESPGIPAFAVGFIGSPPELFDTEAAPLIGGLGFSHTDGTPRSIRIRVNSSDVIQLLLDDAVIWSMSLDDPTLTSLTGFSDLRQSTVHGIALDYHLVRPLTDVPLYDGALDVRFHNWPS